MKNASSRLGAGHRGLAAVVAGPILSMLVAVSASAGQATLSWEANTDPAVNGYMLYYGQAPGSYASKIDVGRATTYTVPNLADGKTYYFSATSYDAGRVESGHSNEVSKLVPAAASTFTASINTSLASGVAPLNVAFTATLSTAAASYAWNFGDGGTSTLANPSHAFQAAGTYNVTLTVRTAAGASATATKTIVVTSPTAGAPTASFTASKTSGTAPLSVTFTNASTGSITGHAWSFGDGGTSTVMAPTYTYRTPGTYTVSLKVSGGGGTNTQTRTGYITVGAAPTGLVAAYGFNEGAGTLVNDRSGNANTATASATTWTTAGRYGGALSFNGSTSLVTAKDSASLDLTGAHTLEAWIYPTVAMRDWRTVLMKEQAGGAVYYLEASSDTGQPAAGLFSGGERILFAGRSLPANTWSHLATTYDGATQRLYINGVLVASRPQTGAVAASTGALRIGGNTIWGEHFQGRIDEVRIYNRALGAAEITRDMNTPVSP